MVLIGKKIKKLRNKYKLTQMELAQQVGVTKSTIAAYENDSRLPSYEVLIRLANVFKVSIDSLLLDRTEVILDAHGLTQEQMDIIGVLIAYFRKSNSIEYFYDKLSPIGKEMIKDHMDTELD